MSDPEPPATGPTVVAIGGGHGLAMTLRAVRTYAARTTAVVATGDDGGSSGRLRAGIAMPAPGDLRRCLTAVSPDRDLAAALEHRFSGGELAGHAVGNLVLAGLVDAGRDLAAAAATVAGWLGLADDVAVVPATAEPVDLVADTPNGAVRGQVAVEGAGELLGLAVDPPAPAVPAAALDALAAADQVVLAPGSFYASVLGALVVPAIRDALAGSGAPVVLVANLRADETGVKGWDVARHVEVLRAHGVSPDVVVAQHGALPVGEVDGVEVVLADVDRPHGLAHDADLLGAVLGGLPLR